MACCGGGKKAINQRSQPATMKNLAKPQKAQAAYSKITLADGKQYRVAGRKQNHIKHAAN